MAFTSTLISVSNLGTWNYYVMSDSAPLWGALNGLAAWFGAQGGMLQSGAWMGSLIALTMVIFGTAIGKRSVDAATIGGWFFFMTTMGMTGTANVVNVYTGTTTVVANVPALALIPASMFSSAAKKVFTTMETAFSSTSGSYMSVSTNGFVGPLDLLLTLRSDKFPASQPALQRTLVQVVQDCGIDPNSAAVLPVKMKDSLDLLVWLKTYGRQVGITNVYKETDPTGKGEVYSCLDALTYVDAQFALLAAGSTPMMEFINANSGKTNPSSATGNWGSSAIGDSFTSLLGGVTSVTQTSLQFTKNALVSATVAGTIDCLGNSGLMTSPDTCATSSLMLADGLGRSQALAAMSGSGFLKTMFTSMGFLQILFFSLFPFIALYGLIVVNKTMVVFGGYVLFGIWSQSWLLVVAPIQSYIQNSVIAELNRAVGSSAGLTMANQSAIFDVLAQKLAVASDMMANSQMLSLALLSGSIYALSGLVGKSSGAQQMDTNLVQKKLIDGSALTSGGTVMSMNTMSNGDGSSTVVGTKTGASSISLSSSNVTSLSAGSTAGNTHSVNNEQSKAQDRVKQELADWGYSEKESASMSKSIVNTLGYQGSINSSMGGAFIKALRAGGGKPMTAEQEKFAGQAFSAAQSKAVNSLVASDSGFWSRFNSDNPEIRAEAQGQAADMAIDTLGTIATVADLASIGFTGGAATPAALAGLAGIQGAKIAAKRGLRSVISSNIKAEAKGTARGAIAAEARETLRNVASGTTVGRFGEAVAGGVGAVASAAHNEVSKKDNGISTERGTARKSGDAASFSAALRASIGDSNSWGYSESSSQSYVQTAAVTMDVAGLARSVENGYGDMDGQKMRSALAFNDKMLRTNGAYSEDDIKAADQKAKSFVSGYTISSNTPGVSSEDIRRGVTHALFQQFLSGKVNTSFNRTNAQAGGSDVTPATPVMKTPDTVPEHQPQTQSGKSKTKGTPPPVQDATLVDAVHGDVPNVPTDKGIVEKITDIFSSNPKEQPTPTQAPGNKPLAATTGHKTVAHNPNKTTSIPPGIPSTQTTSEPIAATNETAPTATSDPSNYVFERQPSISFKNMPDLVNQTAKDREAWVQGGSRQMKSTIDAASRHNEQEMRKSSTPNSLLDQSKLSESYRKDFDNQQSNVNTGVTLALGTQAIATTAGMISEAVANAASNRSTTPGTTQPTPGTTQPTPGTTQPTPGTTQPNRGSTQRPGQGRRLGRPPARR